MEIEIVYCQVWNYEPKAVSLTEKLITEFKDKIKRLVLIPSDSGRFEVSIDGRRIFSKLETGRFPEYQEICKQIKAWRPVTASRQRGKN